jgi:secreted trypsin-like serine protease
MRADVGGTNITYLCQALVEASAVNGDSGAPVFRITNSPQTNDVALMGILWGGNTAGTIFVYSKMSQIQGELGTLNTCATGFSC